MKKTVALLLLALIACGMLAACGGDTPPAESSSPGSATPEATGEREEFYILACSGTEVETMKDVIAEAGDALPYDVIVEDAPWAQFSEKMSLEMASDASRYDLMLMPAQWMGDYVNYLAEIDMDTNDFIDGLVESYQVDGVQYGIPYYAMALMFYYRPDIWEEAGVTSEPETWDEWYADIQAVAEVKPDDMTTTTIPLANTTHLSSFYAVLLWDKGTDVIVDGKVALDTPEAKESLQFMCDLYNGGYLPTSAFELGFSEGSELFAQGQTTSAFDFNRKIAIISDPECSVVSDSWSAFMVPGNASLMGPWGFVIPGTAKDMEASEYMLEWLTSAESMTPLAKTGSAVCRTSVLTDESVLAEVPEMESVLKSLNKAQRELWPNYDAVSQALIKGLSEAVAGGLRVDDALAQMQSEIEAIIES